MHNDTDHWRIAKTTTGRNIFSSWFDQSTRSTPRIEQPARDTPHDNVQLVFSPPALTVTPWEATPTNDDAPPATLPAVIPEPESALEPESATPVAERAPILVEDAPVATYSTPAPAVVDDPPAALEPPIVTEVVRTAVSTDNPLPKPPARRQVFADLVRRSFGTGEQWLLGESTFPALAPPQVIELPAPAVEDAESRPPEEPEESLPETLEHDGESLPETLEHDGESLPETL
ncbi:MAG: hypothetical protein HQM02_04935, partial [Magnetococcales bacterium]|nr:hypothetical protein [Magnetococcales bacterium]